ncbi:MAG: site-2 protease family protein [Planctomycetes bacterium]|nr:site-2 protease family protein [Planctomycetota bacterium]
MLLRLPVVLFSLVIHEYMHGWTAWKCGDDTALRAGRLTFNPLPHLDLIGTLCLMFAPIGWAKPVPVNPYNYEHPRRDDILVSGAGIAANFLLAAGLCLLARVLVSVGALPGTDLSRILWAMMANAILINFGLAVFNLLPIFPLDGSHIVRNLLPPNAAMAFANISRYGMFLLIAVVLINRETRFLLWPIIHLTVGVAGNDAVDVLIHSLHPVGP